MHSSQNTKFSYFRFFLQIIEKRQHEPDRGEKNKAKAPSSVPQ